MRTLLARFGLFSLAGAAALAVGCAAERDPINRVQPNALPKSFFVGESIEDPSDDPEFRLKSFDIDASRQQSAYSVGEFSGVERIRWEITENMLLARRSYQELEGADLRGVPKEQWIQKAGEKAFVKNPNGTVVAAYRITSHFDVRRQYNPSTGEEGNIVEENASDRPWNQREFIRVDWSQNLAQSTRDTTALYGYAKLTPVEYAVTDPTSEDAPHLELESGYFDVTNKFQVEQEDVELSWGSIKRCQIDAFVTGSGSYDCSPQETTMRLSFSRIEPSKEDFESFEDDFAWNDVVGNWSSAGSGADRSLGTSRQAWDPAYGMTDAQTKRLKSIHEIWTKSHQDATCASNDDADKNGTADACENATTGYAGHSGSQCDLLAGRCTIPVRDREVKTIAYHLNKEAPDALQDEVDASGKPTKRGTLEDLGYSWNQLLSVAVAYRREVECRRTGDGDRNACHAEFFESDSSPNAKTMVSFGGWLVDTVKAQPVDQGKPVMTVCHNPVRAYDPEVCGKPGDTARFGDMRKNFLVYWPYESDAHYGGVGANPPDPITGQTFGATATIMGRSATYAAGMQRDIVQLAMGDLSMDEIVEGAPAQKYAAILRSGQAAPAGMTHAKTEAELAAAVARFDPAKVRSETGMIALPDGPALAVADTKIKAKTLRDSAEYATSIAQYDALASKLRSTPFEAQLADGRWMTSVLGSAPNAQITPEMLEMASPLRGLDPARVDALHKWFQQDLADRGACFHDTTFAGVGSVYQASLAGYFKGKYKDQGARARGERIYDDLWKEAVKGIGLHELGHSLGLRHNFASSWDAMNYQPQYWQLRTNEGKAKDACKGPRSGDADSCMGPRYVDPMTPDEQGLAGESRPGIDYFANTSTMEYAIERFGETVGLGTYDLHAMKSLYGRVLEAFDDSVVPPAQQSNFAPKTISQLQEKDLVLAGKNGVTHYTSTARAANVFDPARDCRPATEEEKATAEWRIVHGKVCAPPPKDHAAWDDFKTDAVPVYGQNGVKWHAKPAHGAERVRWPYRYGEQYGAGGYTHTTMQDAGADAYELVQNLERRFDLSYPWSYFRRSRAGWVNLFLPQATASQYFSRLRAYHWSIATNLTRYKAAYLADDDVGRPELMAQGEAFRVLSKALLMPEPGSYAQSAARTPAGSSRPIFDIADGSGPGGLGGAFSLDIADARYIGDDFQNDLGGSWNYQQYFHHASYEVEKALAVMQLVDPRPTLSTVMRENYLDGRAPRISFRTDMADAVDRLLGGVLAEDWEAVAPSVVTDTQSHQLGVLPLDLSLPQTKRDANAMIVFPNVGYKQQLATAVNAALLSRLSGDMDLVNKMRVWLDGDRSPQLPAARQVRLTDPKTGYTYVAGRFGSDVIDGKTVDRGIGSRMLQHGNDFVAAAYDVKRDATGKPVLDDSGRPEVLASEGGLPKVVNEGAETAYRKYLGLVDAMRQLQIVLGNGPLGGQDE